MKVLGRINTIIATYVLVICIVFCWPLTTFAVEHIFIIRAEGKTFNLVVNGISEDLEEEFVIDQLIVYNNSTPEILSNKIREIEPKLIVLMDNNAIELFKRCQPTLTGVNRDIPVIACLGVDIEQAVKGIDNSMAISYEIPIVTAMVNLRSLIDSPMKRVGIVHREFMTEFIRQNRKYCELESIDIITYTLPDSITMIKKELTRGLKYLFQSENVDALWVPNDNVLLRPELINDAWLPAIEKFKKPVIVGVDLLANPVLNLGTLAVVPDRLELGSQVADLIFDIKDSDWKIVEKRVFPPLSIKKAFNLYQAKKYFRIIEENLTQVDTLFTLEQNQTAALVVKGNSREKKLSLGELLNMEITSVSKKAERLQDVASSIYVITEEDIRRSGATRIQDVLNLVPGAWFVDNSYQIPTMSIRETPLLMFHTVNFLVNGVPIISPISGGIKFEGMILPLSEIERIEVIKGPGGTIYGANSVSGVINIFTKRASSKRETTIRLVGGYPRNVSPTVRFNTPLNESVNISAFGQYLYTSGYNENQDFKNDSIMAQSPGSNDGTKILNPFTNCHKIDIWNGFVGNVNLDVSFNEKLSLKSDLLYRHNTGTKYKGVLLPPEPPDSMMNSITVTDNLSTNMIVLNTFLNNIFTAHHNGFLHSYYLLSNNDMVGGSTINKYSEKYHLINFEVQDNLTLFPDKIVQSALSMGVNGRMVHIDIGDYTHEGMLRFTNPNNTEYLISGFIQNRISFKTLLSLICGVKAETWTLINNIPEFSPNFRLNFTPSKHIGVWAGWARGITIPGYYQAYIEFPIAQMRPNLWLTVTSTDTIRPTEYKTTELGIRTSAIPKTFIDVSGFLTLYKDKVGSDDSKIFSGAKPSKIYDHQILPIYYTNLYRGIFYGLEAIGKIQPIDILRMELSYSWFNNIQKGQLIPGTSDTAIVPELDTMSTPKHVWRFRLYLDLPYDLNVTVNGLFSSRYHIDPEPYYYTENGIYKDNISFAPKSNNHVYPKIDITIEKMLFDKRLSFSVWGKNILNDDYIESYNMSQGSPPNPVHRTFGGGVSYTF